MKKKLVLAMLVSSIITLLPISTEAAVISGKWQYDSGKYYYVTSSGTHLTGWIKQGNNWYYLSKTTGEMVRGLFELDGKSYYLDPIVGKMKTGWVPLNNKWYYFKSDGSMAKGWQYIDGNWYFLADTLMNGKGVGYMLTGWIRDKSGNYYYLEDNGRMHTGWLMSGTDWYYLNSNGTMHKGWLDSNGKKYYMGTSSGKLAMKPFKQQDPNNPSLTKWYIPDANGAIK